MTLPVTPWNGEPISADGVYDLTMDAYHGQPCEGPSISSSGLRTIWEQSPAHYWIDSSLNPNRAVDDDERPHFSLGRAAHHLLFLGRKGFDQEFATRPAKWKDWRTAEAKEWRAEQIKAGMTIITDHELELIAGMARSLAEHPMVKSGILDGDVERSLIWKDPLTGVWLKSRPDNITTDGGDYSDLKTTVSVSDHALQRTIADFHYQMQGALVGEASRTVLGVEMQSFTLVFVEKAPPHCVRVITLSDEDLRRGAQQVRAAADIFARCVATGRWHGPGGDQTDAATLPIDTFKAKRIDERLEILKATDPFLQAAE
ncbi:MAG: PD-(D/E)XK nuclease-like domain-containing protein [Caulobacter sp.]|nr:PD-(D/E)XK nuclease-like domain-containing protein [Caulobacter sp.]